MKFTNIIALGMAPRAGLGTDFGAAFGNIALGVPQGVSFGIIATATWKAIREERENG